MDINDLFDGIMTIMIWTSGSHSEALSSGVTSFREYALWPQH